MSNEIDPEKFEVYLEFVNRHFALWDETRSGDRIFFGWDSVYFLYDETFTSDVQYMSIIHDLLDLGLVHRAIIKDNAYNYEREIYNFTLTPKGEAIFSVLIL